MTPDPWHQYPQLRLQIAQHASTTVYTVHDDAGKALATADQASVLGNLRRPPIVFTHDVSPVLSIERQGLDATAHDGAGTDIGAIRAPGGRLAARRRATGAPARSRHHWHVTPPGQPLYEGVQRRGLSTVLRHNPVGGTLAQAVSDYLPVDVASVLPFQFDFSTAGQLGCTVRRAARAQDRLSIEFARPELDRPDFDRRLGVAIAVLLAQIEGTSAGATAQAVTSLFRRRS